MPHYNSRTKKRGKAEKRILFETRSLSKVFPDGTVALDDVSFSAREGEVTGLLGENGAGKTTLFRIAAGLLRPSSGLCRVKGVDISEDQLLVKKSLGILSGSDSGLYDRLTARENIRYFASIHGMDHESASASIERFIGMLDMKRFIDKKIATFSRGMKQRTAIARALVHNPTIVLLDEPTTGLDVGSALVIHDMIRSLCEKGASIIIASHNVHEIRKLCSHIIVLHKGKCSASGSPSSLARKFDNNFEKAFLHYMGYPS